MAAPEIRLSIGLDLEFFRGQMRKAVNIAQSEFTAQLAVKIDRNKLNTELNNLQKAIKRRSYYIEIKGNLEKAPSKIASLKKALSDLEGTKIDLGIGGITSIDRDEARKIRTALRRSILENGGKILVPTSIVAAITNPDVAAFKAAVKGKLSGINVEVGINTQSATANIAAMAAARQQARPTGQEVAPKNITALQTVESFNRAQLQNTRKAMLEAGMAVGDIKNLTTAKIEDYQKSVVKGLTDSGKEAVNGFALGLKDSSSKISQAAAKIGEAGVRGIKDYLGIASPSKVFELIGKFSVDGLQLGFLEGLKEFKGRSVAEVKAIVALLRMELAKVSDTKPMTGASTGSLRRQLLGSQAYSSPIGPLQQGSKEPWATGRKGQFGYSGYEPRMVSTAYGVQPNPLKQFVAPSASRQIQSQIQSTASQAAPPAKYPWFLNRAPYVPGPMMGPGGSTWSGAGSQRGIAPPAPPAPPGGGGAGAGGGGAGAGGAGRRGGVIGGLNIPNLPGAGLVQELGTEFAFAAKQVLLFGTAYKALAFLTGFPQQVMNAVSSLQSFQNTLRAVTPSAQEFSTSSKFILSLVDQYNIPLQSARDGFAKLYASMKPAGFSGQEIRGLFEGVSMGAATFGMSADKVDRVMYAFAQMASKGQVMSEELKGQLGDVLPGALALFARAAKMSLTDFGKAMEDGAFKGKAMRQLLVNVGATMKEEFGKGAVGAALTFQGVMNRLQTTTVLFYETFEPLAVAFANTFVLPLTNGVRVVTDAFRQLTTGQAALTQGGSDLAAKMQPLIPVFNGIGDNIKMAVNAALDLAKAFVPVVQLFLQIISIPIVGVLAQVYTSVLLLNSVFTLLGGKILLNLIGNLIQTVVQMTALNLASVATTSSLTGTRMSLALLSSGFATTGAAATAFASVLRTAMMTTVVGAIATAVAFGISEFMRLRGVMDSIAGRYKSIGDQARLMGESGNVSGVQRLTKNLQDQANTYEKIAAGLNRAQKGGGFVKVDKDTQELLKRTGFGGYDSANNGILKVEDANNIKAAINNNRTETEKTRKILAEQESKAKSEAAKLDAKLKKDSIPPGEGDASAAQKAAEKAQKAAEKLASQNQQLSIDAANRQNALDKTRFESLASLTDEQYQHELALIDSRNAYELTGRNSIEARQRKFQQDLLQVELRRINAVKKAQADVQKAQLDVTIATRTAQAAQSNEVSFMPGRKPGSVSPARGSSFQGFEVTSLPGESRAYRNGTHEGYDFATPIGTALSYAIGGVVKSIDKIGRGNAGKLIEVTLDNGIVGLSMHLSEVMLEAGQRFEANQIIAKTGDTGAGPPHLHQESAAHAYRTGQAGASLAYLNIGKGNAQGARSSAVNTMQRREDKTENKAEVEQLQLLNTAQLANIAIRNSMAKAIEEAKTLIAQNIDTIYPVAEMQLENNLMKMRNNLQMQGMPSEYIDFREKTSKADYEGSLALEKISFQLKENENNLAAMQKKKADNVSLSAEEVAAYGNLSNAIEYLTEKVNKNKEGLASLEVAQKAFAIASLESAIATMKNADALKIQQDAIALVNSSVEGATNSYKGFVKEVMQGGDPTEALKKFQESLSDQVLTIFLDYAFKPVEDFLKDSLKNMLNLPTEEDQRKKAIADAEAQLGHLKTIDANVSTIAGQSPQAGAATPAATTAVPAAGGQAAGGPIPLTVIPFGGAESSAMSSTLEGAQSSISKSMEGITSSVEKSSFKLLEGVPPFEQALTIDLPGQVEKSTEALKAKGSTFNESLGKLTQGVGIAIGSIMGIMAGMSQIKKGGTGNTLMGIGSILASVGGGIGGFMKLKGANGGTAAGGWKPFPARAFANGGMVKGPTLGLVGEGKYNEAIVPLPDGRSIPVQMRGGPGGGSSRDLLASQSQSRSSPSVLSMSFQSTTINGVEYVDRAQLEMAMAETRRVASRDGAARGANLAIDRLANSPSSRRRAGIR